jgi:hypothetical protein
MTAETTSARSDPAEADLLWPEEVADLIGVDRLTVTQYLKQARRHGREHTRTEYEIPEPVKDPHGRDRWRRSVPGGKDGTVVVNSNRWRRSDILAWRERVANRPSVRRGHGDAGKFDGNNTKAGICHPLGNGSRWHDHGPGDACPVALATEPGDSYADGAQ